MASVRGDGQHVAKRQPVDTWHLILVVNDHAPNALIAFAAKMLPLLKLASDGSEHTLSDAIEQLANEFQLSEVDRKELLPSGKQARLNNRVGWASSYLRKAGLLRTVRWGTFQITDRGRRVLQSNPPTIDL